MSKLGGAAQFTYDFGISIAQSTVSQVMKLTGATLTLAGAFYALQKTGEEYANTLKRNSLRFGGMVATMKQMEAAQDRLLKGITFDSVDNQLEAMNNLEAAGINVAKNFNWIAKAAHATGRSVADFSSAVRSAVGGNMSQLVDMGLLTERAARRFQIYGSNTVMQQQAVMNFLKHDKALLQAMRDDFYTIGDEMMRLREVIHATLESIIGKPNDPESWYHSIVTSLSNIADAFARNINMIRNYGRGIGIVMGYFTRQVGKVIVWLGGVAKSVTMKLLGSSDDFVDRMRTLVVWLEFWRQEIVDALTDAYKAAVKFYHAHKKLIDTTAKVLLGFLAWKFIVAPILISIAGGIGTIILRTKALSVATGLFFANFWKNMSRIFTYKFLKHAGVRRLLIALGISGYQVEGAFGVLGEKAAIAFDAGFASVKGLGRMIEYHILRFSFARKILRGFSKAGSGLLSFGVGLGKGVGNFFVKGFKGALNVMKVAPKQTFGAAMQLMKVMWKGTIRFMVATAKLPYLALVKWFKFSELLWTQPLKAMGMLKNGILWVLGIIPRTFAMIRAGITAINATNPVGWVVLGITLLAVMYRKLIPVRRFLNATVEVVINALKIIWNLLNVVYVYTRVGIRKVWQFLKWLWQNIKSFFRWLWNGIKSIWNWLSGTILKPLVKAIDWIIGKIRKLWNAFMDSRVGRWLKNIVDTISKFFHKMPEYVKKGVQKSGEFAEEAGNKNGISTATFNTPTSLDYNKDFLGAGFSAATNAIGGFFGGGNNSLVDKVLNMDLSNYSGRNPQQDSRPIKVDNHYGMTIDPGAIQINVTNTGDGTIDEHKLAQQIKAQLLDLQREQRVRGGNLSY